MSGRVPEVVGISSFRLRVFTLRLPVATAPWRQIVAGPQVRTRAVDQDHLLNQQWFECGCEFVNLLFLFLKEIVFYDGSVWLVQHPQCLAVL